MPNDTDAFERIFSENSAPIIEFCQTKSASFPAEALTLVRDAVQDAVDSEPFRLKAFLPLCDALVSWRTSRLPPSAVTAPNPALTHLDADTVMIEITTALAKNLSKYGRLEQLLEDRAWARGERLRLLAPLVAFTEYGCSPKGLEVHLTGDFKASGPLVTALCVGLNQLRIVARTLYRIGSGKRELVEANKTFDVSKAMKAAIKAVEWVVHELHSSLSQMSPVLLATVLSAHLQLVVSLYDNDNSRRKIVNDFSGRLLGALIKKLATPGPDADQAASSEDILGAMMTGSNDICNYATVFALPSRETLFAAISRLDQEADAVTGYHSWLCRCVSFGFHCIDLRFAGLINLEGTAAAYLALMAQPTDWAPGDLSLEAQLQHDMHWASRMLVDSISHAMAAGGSPGSGGQISLDFTPDPDPVLYMRNLRCANAVLVAVPHLDEDVAMNTAMVLTFFISGVRSCRPPGASLTGASADLVPTASQLARALASNSCRAALSALAADPPLPPVGARVGSVSHPQVSRAESASYFAQLVMWALYEVCVLTTAAQKLAESDDDAALPLQQAVAVTLRVLHVLERLGPVRDLTQENAPAGSTWHLATAMDTEDAGELRCLLAALEPELAPVLTPTTAPALQWLAQMKGVVDEGVTISKAAAQQHKAAAERLTAMATDAEARDLKDEGVQKARAKILGTVRDCAYPLCRTMRPPTPEGNVTAIEYKLKSCSGCRVVRFCGPGCQKADWKNYHKIACRALQAERGGQ